MDSLNIDSLGVIINAASDAAKETTEAVHNVDLSGDTVSDIISILTAAGIILTALSPVIITIIQKLVPTKKSIKVINILNAITKFVPDRKKGGGKHN